LRDIDNQKAPGYNQPKGVIITMRNNAFESISHAAEVVNNIKQGLEMTTATIEKTTIQGHGKLYPEDLCRELKDIIARMDEVHKDLEKPHLRLAFVGTTSAGKSTLVNALVGQAIVPIKQKPMSAGVVRIRNGKDMGMEVLETPNMKWEKGKFDVHSANDIYKANEEIMEKYHDAVKENVEVKAPRIDITLPAIAAKNGGIPSSLIEIPKGIELELIDLPGIKTVVDPLNMEVIQQNLVGAFLIIVMNFLETDEDKINKLLSEVKRTVDSICRNPKALLFILNRVDARNFTDDAVNDVISQLEIGLKEKLGLPEIPVIYPMKALYWFYLQTAWGPEETPLFNKGGREDIQSYIKAFLIDGARSVKLWGELSDEKKEKEWFDKYNNFKPEELPDEAIQQLLPLVYEESGAKRFWKALQAKLDENIGAVIINPAFRDTVNLLEDFSRSTQGILSVRKLTTEAEISRQLDRVKSLTEEIKKNFELFKEKLSKDLDESQKQIRAGDVPIIPEFTAMNQVMMDIRADIYYKLLDPVFSCIFNPGAEAYESLKESLLDHIPRKMAISIHDAVVDLISKHYTEEDAKEGRSIQVDENEKNQEKLDERDKLLRIQEQQYNVYKCVCAAMHNRCQLLLQEKVYDFNIIIKKITTEKTKELARELRENNTDRADLASLLIPPARVDDSKKEIDLTGVKAISDAWTHEFNIRDKNFTETIETLINAVKDLLKRKPVNLDRKVPVVKYRLHSVDESIKYLADGWLEETLKRIWVILCDEMSTIIEEEVEAYGKSLEKSEEQIKEALEKQFEIIKQDLESILSQTQETADQISREATRYEGFQREILRES
jgi:GTPase SAR1 family protein